MIPEFAQSLYQRFKSEGIPLLLAGGWAVCHHGYSRLTIDVDWVCPRSRQSAAVALMDQLGFEKTTDGMASRFKNRKQLVFPYIDLIWGMTIPSPGWLNRNQMEIQCLRFRQSTSDPCWR